MANLLIERIGISDPEVFAENVGQPVANQGGASVPAVRTALRHAVTIPTLAPDGSPDTFAARMTLRRRLRALVNNLPYKLQGTYLTWAADSENSGAYVPDQGQIVSGAEQAGLATGYFKADQLVWQLVARLRTHRRAVYCFLKDRRLSTMWRDYYKTIFSTDFGSLQSLNVTWLPATVTDALNVDSGSPVTAYAAPTISSDGTTMSFAVGLTDLARVSFEQPETNVNSSDVIVYDRRGTITAPAGGPDAAWEDAPGPDYPWSSGDVPVVENGRCRVRWNSANTAGFSVDVWNGSAWAEQGKVTVIRDGDQGGVNVTTLVSAVCLEYTPDRAVLLAVMSASGDALSRERVVITLQRGWSGPRFEGYPAPVTAGTTAGMRLRFEVFAADANDSLVKIDTVGATPLNTGVIAATAGTGSALFGGELTLGAATFTGENEVALLRQGQTYAATVAVLQAGVAAKYASETGSYGASRNELTVQVAAGRAGYVTALLGFYPQQADALLEAEAMTLGTGTSSVADGAASGGQTTQSTRTTDANAHVTRATWPNGQTAKYRIFARVKTSASTLNVYAKTGLQVGGTKTTTSTSYVWLDLGDILANNTTLEIHCWASSAATVSLDRLEAVKVEDRTSGSPDYDGMRDAGQAALTDSRSIRRWVTRS